MAYVDGFLLPIPKKNLVAYRELAEKASKIWKEHGALDYRECVGDDVNPQFGLPFPKAAQCGPDDVVIFSYIVYKSKAHRDEVRATLIGVAIVAVGALGFTTFQERRQASAEKAFSDAWETFHAPVAAELAPGADKPARVDFATSAEKYQKAAAAFDGVERRYGSLPAGRRARYYAALSRIEMGDYAEAEKALDKLAADSERSSLESGLVPRERAPRCAEDLLKVAQAWDRRLQEHTQP